MTTATGTIGAASSVLNPNPDVGPVFAISDPFTFYQTYRFGGFTTTNLAGSLTAGSRLDAVPNVTIGDFVWNDSNANGIQDSGEPGINGVTLTLTGTNAAGQLVTDHATTSGNGGYLFTEAPGTYTVTVDASNFNSGGALAGYTASPTLQGTPATDSNANPSGTTPGTLAAGGSDLTVDFGYFKPGINIVKLTNGTNNDAPPVAGVPDGPTVPVGSTVTWTYNVTNPTGVALSGVNVTDNIAGVNPTPVLSGGFNVGDTNHDGLLENGETWQFTASGTAIAGQYSNVGTATGTPVTPTGGTITGATPVTASNPDHYYGTLSIGDFVWNDTNANGIQDSADLTGNGINGVLVDLKNSGGTIIATTTTANNPVGGAPGYYQFSGLLQGSYTVVIDSSNFASGGPLAGYLATPSTVAGSTPANDSNGSPAGVTLSAANDETIDFGYYKPVTIGDFVWNDANANGIQDSGEAGIGGVTLTLTGTNGAGQAVTDHATTDATGHYLFTEVPGTYTVAVDDSNFAAGGALAGYTASPTLVGSNRAVDSNVSPSGTTPAALPGGSSDLTLDFGYYTPAGAPDLTITKVADSASVTAGSTIGFTVTITNTGTATATGITLSDPLPPGGGGDILWTIVGGNTANFQITGSKGSQVLSLTATGSTLSAGASESVHITSPTNTGDVSGGLVGVSSGVNPAAYLGAAGDYAVLYEGTGGHNLSITNVSIGGNVGVGGTGHVQFSGPGAITGRLDLTAANTGQFSNNNGSNVGPASVNYSDAVVTTALNTVNNLSSSLAGLGTNIALNGNQTINESAGQLDTVNGVTYRVFNVTSYSENDGKLVTINGDGSGDPVVFNFGFNSNVNLGGDVALTGNGLSDDKLIWNFTASGKAVSLNNNASSFPGVAFHGIILAPLDTISLVNANLSGRVFGGNSSDMQIVSGDTIHAPVLNTATVTASNVTIDSDDTASATITITGSSFKPPRALVSADSGVTATGNGVVGFGYALQQGTVQVYVDNSNGDITTHELARIDDAIAAYNAELAPDGLTLVEVAADKAVDANITISMSDTTPIGGAADGVLGVTEPNGAIVLVDGWNWYTGSNPNGIGAHQYDFETVAMHELGHGIGLGHSTDKTSVMYPTLSDGVAKRGLSATDLTLIDIMGGMEPLLAAGLRATAIPSTPALRSSSVGDELAGPGLRGLSINSFVAVRPAEFANPGIPGGKSDRLWAQDLGLQDRSFGPDLAPASRLALNFASNVNTTSPIGLEQTGNTTPFLNWSDRAVGTEVRTVGTVPAASPTWTDRDLTMTDFDEPAVAAIPVTVQIAMPTKTPFAGAPNSQLPIAVITGITDSEWTAVGIALAGAGLLWYFATVANGEPRVTNVNDRRSKVLGVPLS
jgi:uncharacterized repeat protein (TIGR01451 family)